MLATDGGSRGNPGPAAIGYVLTAADGTLLAAQGEAIGVAGANVAEYRALLAGLEHASRLGLGLVDARCDARLVVEHVSGVREPTNPRLRELCGAVREVAERIGTVAFTWVPAEANTRAHQLVAERSQPHPDRPQRGGTTTPTERRTVTGSDALDRVLPGTV